MNLKGTLLIIGACLLLIACASNSSKTTENIESEAIMEEVQQLDSLSNDLDKSTTEIEESTKDLEEAIKELDYFN